ncbi:MAG TPA: twin-arginine translocase subunit TatC [Gammaproteobacteria bacterium]|nr:twin-arginine translocase subunit TatC [Gammaproteobacteria bacterium]
MSDTNVDHNNGDEEQLAEGTLLSHLIELRSRVVKSVATVVVLLICLVPFTQKIFDLVAYPLMAKLPAGHKMLATHPASTFFTPFKTTVFVAILLAMPVILYQVWSFVSPGLYRREKRFAVPLLVSSVVLFYTGMLFAYYVVFPLMFSFFSRTTPSGVQFSPDIAEYLSFVMTLLFAFGVAFEVPIATVLLTLTGLISLKKLRSFRPYVLLGCFVVAMFLTPPDAISQTLLAVPMYALYEGGILMARVLLPDKAVEADEAEADGKS